MLHISNENDVELLTQMIGKFCNQNKDVRFGNYVFGPPIMRLFYHLKVTVKTLLNNSYKLSSSFFKDSDSALKLFKDEKLDGFFDQLVSYQLLMDLLYESGRYQEVLETFEIIKTRQLQGGPKSKHVFVLTLAACYKLNTPASFDFASNLWKEATNSGLIV